jgi:hypothetical protein
VEPRDEAAELMSLTAPHISGADIARNFDLLVLAIAFPVFVALDAPIAGYLAAGGAWVIGRIAKAVADRRRDEALRSANRNAALGLTAAAMLGRLWILAAAILIVGLAVDRDAGLAGAVLAAVLVTVYLAGEGIATLIEGDPGEGEAA